jgi:hypothetical protein
VILVGTGDWELGLNHVSIALGSQAGLDTALELAVRLAFVAAIDIAPLVARLERLGRMLHRLAASLERKVREANS